MNIEEYLEEKDYIDRWHPTGSRFICDPPVMNTDIDYLCFCTDNQYTFKLQFEGWSFTNPNNSGKYEGCERHFDTFRRNEYNLIITKDFDFYCRFAYATHVAKKQNLTNKQDRINLFQEILYGRMRNEES